MLKNKEDVMYAERIAGLRSSAIRDILKLMSRPGIISFAGGLPAPELFPIKEIGDAVVKVLSRHGSSALQYSITEGIIPLREKIIKKLDKNLDIENIIITQGSQQGLDLISKLYIDKGTVVFTETPSYLGALQAFQLFQANVIAIPSDEKGIQTDELEKKLKTNKPGYSISCRISRTLQAHPFPWIEDTGCLRLRGNMTSCS